MNVDSIKLMYFRANKFDVGVNDNIYSGNEKQKVYYYYHNRFYLLLSFPASKRQIVLTITGRVNAIKKPLTQFGYNLTTSEIRNYFKLLYERHI